MVFSLSGFMIVWLGHPQVNCAMWLPLLFYFVEKTFLAGNGNEPGETKRMALPMNLGSEDGPLTPPLSPKGEREKTSQKLHRVQGFNARILWGILSLRAWAGLAVTYGFMLLGGHPPTAIHVTLAVLVYFAFRLAGHSWRQALRRLALLAGALACGVMLAAPQLLPYLEYYHHSSSGIAYATLQRGTERLPPNSLIYFLLPRLSGSPADGFDDLSALLNMGTPLNFSERTGYVGILPIMLVLVAVTGRRCKFTWFYFAMVVISLLIVLGAPPLPALLGLVPLLQNISQVRLLLLIGFAVAVLAGLGWDTFCEMGMRRVVRWTVLVFLAGLGGAFLWLWLNLAPNFPDLGAAHRAYLMGQFLMLAGSALAAGALILWPAQGNRWVPRIVCLGWTAADLLCFGMGYNPAIPRDRYYPAAPAIQWLKQDPFTF